MVHTPPFANALSHDLGSGEASSVKSRSAAGLNLCGKPCRLFTDIRIPTKATTIAEAPTNSRRRVNSARFLRTGRSIYRHDSHDAPKIPANSTRLWLSEKEPP